ncbi:MAG: histidine kinase [Chitinophagales bacterium]
MTKTNKKTWRIIQIIAVVSALIPIVITAFELITTNKESVVFLENFHPTLSLIVLFYYGLLMVLGVSWLIKQLINQIKFLLQLKNEKTRAELLHLKSQVNPHFFFNMLNNLYGLVGKDDKKAQDLILKLSDLMRYSIYEGQKDFVPISEEVEYLKNYIELNKMRYHKKIDIQFEEQIEEDYQVMPLLFILLLENAFKHGVEKLTENAYVHINIFADKEQIQLTVENNFDSSEKEEQAGIGLKNLKRRLQLAYPDQHALSFSITGNVYKAKLKLAHL